MKLEVKMKPDMGKYELRQKQTVGCGGRAAVEGVLLEGGCQTERIHLWSGRKDFCGEAE